MLRQTLVAESVAGDSAVTHAATFESAVEKLTGGVPSARLGVERAVALELERMAMQIADTGALCMDVGYQLGQVACEALRTMTINTTQAWCGNRFGKGLIRPGGTNHPLTAAKAETIRRNVAQIARRYDEVRRDIKSSPSLLARFEQCATRCSASAAWVRRPARAARPATSAPRTRGAFSQERSGTKALSNATAT